MICVVARTPEPDFEISDVVPAPEFRELHARFIAAPPAAVWAALHEVAVSEVPVTAALMWLRTAGRAGGASDRTLWSVLPVPVLYEVTPTYALAAGVGRPWTSRGSSRPGDALDIERFCEPGWAKVATDFRLVPTADGTVLTTETRVATTDAVSRRRFAAYWAVVRPFSGLIRRDVLAAVDRAATRRSASA